VQGKPSPYVITVFKLIGQKVAGTIECVTHDDEHLGVIDGPDAAQWNHFGLPFFHPWPDTGNLPASNDNNCTDTPVRTLRGSPAIGVWFVTLSTTSNFFGPQIQIFLTFPPKFPRAQLTGLPQQYRNGIGVLSPTRLISRRKGSATNPTLRAQLIHSLPEPEKDSL
jgi:hypothetical protein